MGKEKEAKVRERGRRGRTGTCIDINRKVGACFYDVSVVDELLHEDTGNSLSVRVRRCALQEPSKRPTRRALSLSRESTTSFDDVTRYRSSPDKAAVAYTDTYEIKLFRAETKNSCSVK